MGATSHPDQGDLFLERVFPTRSATGHVDISRFRSKMKRAMAQAIRDCPYDRHTIALRMAQILGLEGFSKATLDAYTAESKGTHDISLVRFAAFVRAAEASWLWDVVVAEEGLTVLEGDEVRLAEIARLQQERDRISAQLRGLRSTPVTIKRRGAR